MALTFQDYLNHIKTAKKFKPRCKIELLDKDEHVVSGGVYIGRILDGTLNVQKNNGVRRTSSFILQNSDKSVTPSVDKFWVNQKYALYLGFNIDGEDYFIKQGIFVASNPQLDMNGSMSQLSISGTDKWALLDGTLAGNLTDSFNIPIGSDINTYIYNVLNHSSISIIL